MMLTNKKHPPHRPHPQVQQGITLIELMIALVIGLLATGAMLKVYVDSSRLYRFNEGLARIQENGRFATEFIRRDARVAGFWGCNHGASLTNRIDSETDYPDIDGTNNDGLNEADSITFSGAGNSVATVSSDMTTPDSDIPISRTKILEEGDALLISDCETANIFQLTSIEGSGSNQTLIHDTPGNTSEELSKAYAAGSRLYRVQKTTFCIAPGADPEQPSLRRLTNPASSETCKDDGDELVEGIENIQVLFGEDTDADDEGTNGDGTANRYVDSDASGLDMDRVVSLRIFLLARSLNDNLTTEPSPYYFVDPVAITPTDKRLRKVFTTTITLRNKTG